LLSARDRYLDGETIASAVPAEVRAGIDDEAKRLATYAAKYTVARTALYDPQQIISLGAIAKAVNDHVTCNIEHEDLRNFLGRTPNTLTPIADAIGVRFGCLLANDGAGQKGVCAWRRPVRLCGFVAPRNTQSLREINTLAVNSLN
jgi:hypothetical protein